MKIRLLYLIFFLITITYQKECKRDLMQSYGLHGLKEAVEKINPVCHTIKKNCCSSHDVLKIFDLVSTSLQPTLVSFYEKMNESTTKLKKLHESIQKVTQKEFVDPTQKNFCKKSKKEFKEFKFQEMIDKLTLGYEKAMNNFRDTHYAFYCVLCDFEAHVNIDLKSKKLSLDSTTCMQQIRTNKDYVAALNVDLVNYFESLQNLLDCAFYEKSFEFPFLFEYQESFKVHTKNCLELFDEDSNEMIDQCAPFCEQMNIAGISRHFEGDPGFVLKAVDYYENLVEEVIQKAEKRAKIGKEFNPMDHLASLKHENPAERALHDLTLIRKKGKITRVLHDVRKIIKHKKEIKNKKQQKHRYKKYIHALKKKNHRIRRILEVNKPSGGLSPEQMDKYKNIYEEINCLFHPKSEEIFKRTIDPIDISSFTRTYLYEQGLNTLKYLEGLNFDLNREEILKTIHGPSNSEKMEYNLIVLLDEVSKIQIEEINEELTKNYNIELPEDLVDPKEEQMLALEKTENELIEIIGLEGFIEEENDSEGGVKEGEGDKEEKKGEEKDKEERILEDLVVKENDIEKYFIGESKGIDFHV